MSSVGFRIDAELVVGIAIALSIQLAFAAILWAGRAIDIQAGFGLASRATLGQRADVDPVAGYDTLVNEGYVSCGVPWSVWEQVQPETPASAKLPGRTGRNADLPYFATAFTRAETGVELI